MLIQDVLIFLLYYMNIVWLIFVTNLPLLKFLLVHVFILTVFKFVIFLGMLDLVYENTVLTQIVTLINMLNTF